MRQKFQYFLLIQAIFLCMSLRAQTTASYAVQLSVVAGSAPPKITLNWSADPNATSQVVHRKPRSGTSWSTAIATLPGSDTTFSDLNVAAGDAWEYRVTKYAPGYTGYGYCFAGLERPVQDYYGKVILVVDTTYATALAPEINRLVEDLWGDGWQVIRLDVDRTDAVTAVKLRIQNEWLADPVNVRSAFLLGHVPVPYSGNLNPDGHPEHRGAWPADGYYGEMNGTWTDNSVNNVTATRPQNQNAPGDGKFDQTLIPSDIDLEVGRADFANMPLFTVGEQALLRRYLNKDHEWRMKNFTVQDKAVIDDNFGVFSGEAFAASGWRLAPLVGPGNAYTGDFRTNLAASNHLWAYGCGGGTYQSASGVGSTTNFSSDSLRAVFTMLFGSYHGDWDSDNNFMRAALASKGHILTCGWAGRPHWHFHHMGLGEPIGYSAKTTQNNSSLYIAGAGARNVHIGLMGDPSLRMHICAPPSSLIVSPVNGGKAHELNWTASPDTVLGYAIFRQDTLDGRFWRIGMVGMATTTFTDSCMAAGDYRYMVRAEELRTGFSGSYRNLSQGAFDTIINATVYTLQTSPISPQVFCPGDTLQVSFTATNDLCGGNTFTAEISDGSGSFLAASPIGTANGFSSGSITCVLPTSLVAGTGYRIRVNGSLPSVTGADNGADLELMGMPLAGFSFVQNGLSASFTNNSTNFTSVWWDFGDGNASTQTSPSHSYAADGSYSVQLIVSNVCGSDTIVVPLTAVGVRNSLSDDGLIVSPNPAANWFEVRFQRPNTDILQLRIVDILGNVVHQSDLQSADHRISTANWARGTYIVEIGQAEGTLRRVVVLK